MNLKKIKDSASSEIVNFINEVHPEWEPIQWADGAIVKIPRGYSHENLQHNNHFINVTTNPNTLKVWEDMEFIPSFLGQPSYEGYNGFVNYGESLDSPNLRADEKWSRMTL